MEWHACRMSHTGVRVEVECSRFAERGERTVDAEGGAAVELGAQPDRRVVAAARGRLHRAREAAHGQRR